MSINYPTSLDSLPNPTNTDLLENATLALDHDQQHANANDAIEALEAKVGINGSAVTTSHDYKLSAVTGSAKALTSGTSTQSVTGLNLTNPTLTVGSDATGDMYYRNSSGALTRLPIGSSGQIIQVSSGGIPEYIANPSAADASTTVKGVVELATQAEIEAGTSTGATGAKLVVPNDSNGARFNAGYASAGGTANAITVTLSPVPSAYFTGMKVVFKATATNTGATTINVNSLGAKDIKKMVSNALVGGDILNGGIYELVYDGSNFQINSSALSIANQKVIGDSTLTAIDSSSITTTVITHGLGVIPRVIRLTASRSSGANNLGTLSYGMAVVNTSGTVTFQKVHTQTTQSGASSQTYFDASGIAIIAGATSQSVTLTIGTITSTQMTITCPAVGFGTISTGADIKTIWEVEA